MKTDLFTAIVVAIVGGIGAFVITNFLVPQIQDVSYKTIESGVNTKLADPDIEVFNYKAINPTVEVYVGECTEYNEFGECVEQEPQDGTEPPKGAQENE